MPPSIFNRRAKGARTQTMPENPSLSPSNAPVYLASICPGTPLGDPIELGAAAAAFGGGRGTSVGSFTVSPLTFLVSKSWLGHAEPAAGAVSVVHSASALHHHAELEVLHLRSPNPYVSGALQASGHAAGAFRAPRQLGPCASIHTSEAAAGACGVSAFAFQGTNAHVLLQPPTAAQSGLAQAAGGATVALPWSRERLWVLPELSCLLRKVLQVSTVPPAFSHSSHGSSSSSPSGPYVLLEAPLGRPQLAGLMPGFAVAGLAGASSASEGLQVAPASLLVQLAAAAVRLALPAGGGGGVLSSATFTALPVAASTAALAASVVLCRLNVRTGSVELLLQAGPSSAAVAGARLLSRLQWWRCRSMLL